MTQYGSIDSLHEMESRRIRGNKRGVFEQPYLLQSRKGIKLKGGYNMTKEEWFKEFKKAYMEHFKLTDRYLSVNDKVILKIAKGLNGKSH